MSWGDDAEFLAAWSELPRLALVNGKRPRNGGQAKWKVERKRKKPRRRGSRR